MNEEFIHYLPTPKEIASACIEIQSTWSDQERESRAGNRGHHFDFDTDFSLVRHQAELALQRRLRQSRSGHRRR